jgi:hypothetical protein
MPPGITDPKLLGLLGDILGPGRDPAATGAMRLRLLSQGFSWQSLVDLASGQDVLLPLIFALSERGLLLPVPRSTKSDRENHVTARLEVIYRQHFERRKREKRQLEDIQSVLDDAGIVALILKGARYLVAPVGSWCEARTMRDIDLLVHPGDGERALAALVATGYQYGANIALKHHHFPALWRPGEPVALEVHTEAHPFDVQRVMSTEHVWAHAIKPGTGTFLVMSNRWHALHCMLHHQMADHGYRRRILAVKALWEWTMLAGDFSGEDWVAIVGHMEAAGSEDVLASWLLQAHRLFGAEIPALVMVSSNARANADATFRLASTPHWLRRTRFIADQLRFSFARETLAMRYGVPPSRVSLVDAGRYLAYLFRQHRGRVLLRLTGRRDRPS